MAMYQTDAAKGFISPPVPMGAGEVVSFRQEFAVTAAIAEESGAIIEMLAIPPGCEVRDLILDTDDLDSDGAPAIVLDCGVMSGEWTDDDDTRTCDDEFLDGVTTGQAGGVVRPTLATAFRVTKTDAWRSIGVKVATVAATGQAGTLGLTVFYAAA